MQSGRDQTGRMRDVGEEIGADLVRDLAEACVVDRAAVCAGAGDDRSRPHFLRAGSDDVVVDHARFPGRRRRSARRKGVRRN